MRSIRTLTRVAFAVLAFTAPACAGSTAEKSNAQTDPTNAAGPETPMPAPLSLNEADPALVAPPPKGTAPEMDDSGGMKMDESAGMKMDHGAGMKMDHSAGTKMDHSAGTKMDHSAGMKMDHGAGMKMDHGGGATPATIYTCPMHPEVRMPAPGRCPKCGMKLVPVEKPDGGGK